MYVCNCNGVTKREVEEAVAAGARRPKDVLAHHGCEPCCGRCLPEIADAIEGESKAPAEVLVAAE